ncbi:MAG: hypothetical protein JW791_03755 [Nanoarchaeota archaeon]|nr:hypothetical protein [Nanoarchaeota archaeon]
MQDLENSLLKQESFNPFVKPGEDVKYSLKDKLRDKFSSVSQYFSNKVGRVITKLIFPYL